MAEIYYRLVELKSCGRFSWTLLNLPTMEIEDAIDVVRVLDRVLPIYEFGYAINGGCVYVSVEE